MRSSLRLVAALDARHLTSHRVRALLAVAGVASGVALAVAVSALGSSINRSLHGISEAAASTANLEVRGNTHLGLPHALINEISKVKGVQEVGATVESYTKLRSGKGEERALLVGLDSGVLKMAPEAIQPKDFRRVSPLSLVLPKGLAQDLDVGAGDHVDVATANGWQRRPIGAIIRGDGAGGRIAVGSLNLVQSLVGRSGGVDAFYIRAADPDAVQKRLADVVGDLGRVGPVALRTGDVGEMLASTTASLNVASIVALFVGGFLVFNTMAMAAVERTGEAALLRAVGATRRQVFSLFVAEGALLGVVGSAIGVFFGIVLARILLATRGAAVEDVFPVDITTVVLDDLSVLLAFAAGIAVSVLAAWLPARRVSRVQPASALAPAGALEESAAGPRALTAAAGVVLFAAGASLTVWDLLGRADKASSVSTAGLVLALSGAALLVRVGVPLVARLLLGRLARGGTSRGAPVSLAAGEVLRSPGRTAFTAGAVLLALSLVVGFSIALGSFTRSFQSGMDRIVRADMYVRTATWRPFGSDVPLNASMGQAIEEVPGVAAAYPFRMVLGNFRNRVVVFNAIDYPNYGKLPGLDPSWRREVRELARKLAKQDTVVITPSVTSVMGIRVGDRVKMPTPSGVKTLEVVGYFPDPSAVTPTFSFDFRQFTSTFRTATADSFGVGLDPGADPERVRGEILKRLRGPLGIEVDSRAQFVDRINGIVGSIRDLISSVQLVAVVVAALGLANTLLISTLERRRDLGVLRAVGMLRGQVRRMVTVEALLVGGVGVLLAWVFGSLIGLFMFRVMQEQSGIDLRLAFPASAYVGSAVLGLAASGLASLYPAARAARMDVVDALQYE
ncbi:MAG TPA: FtsX-like permease family protein [Actinomycetota bacterium]|nr:FtsX-like permease family protein [Actinomycetota bacterium]